MEDHHDGATLLSEAKARRDRAAEARRLAAQITDPMAKESLLRRADTLIAEAEALERQAAALRKNDET